MQGVKPKFGHRILARSRAINLVIPDLLLRVLIGKRRKLFDRGRREHLGEPCDRTKSFHTIYLPGFSVALEARRTFHSGMIYIPVQPYGNVLSAVCLFLSAANPRTILR